MAVFLTQNSPGLRTSPVKRGYWVVRRVLGETIPPPPPTVPELPHDEAKLGSAVARNAGQTPENPACASCHARFDSFGLAFEGYGPIGERRSKDLAGRPVDTQAVFPGGSQGSRIRGLAKPTSASIARKTSSTISAEKCWPTRSAGRSALRRAGDRADARPSWRRTDTASLRSWKHRHQPAVPEQTKPEIPNRTER